MPRVRAQHVFSLGTLTLASFSTMYSNSRKRAGDAGTFLGVIMGVGHLLNDDQHHLEKYALCRRTILAFDGFYFHKVFVLQMRVTLFTGDSSGPFAIGAVVLHELAP